MERDDLRQVMERLEAVAALSTLFKNLWYEKIKGDVADEKVRAYLTVYEDAVPLMNHIIQYTHYSASLLGDGRLDQDRYERLQMAFGQLGAALLGREEDAGMVEMPGLDELESSVEMSPEQEAEMERELFEAEELHTVPRSRLGAAETMNLEGVSQDEVEALLTDTSNGVHGGIDSLFEDSESHAQPASSQEEIDALLRDPADELEVEDLDELPGEETEVEPAEEVAELEDHLDLEEAQETEPADGTEEDLNDLLDSMADENGQDEQETELDLAGGQSEEEEADGSEVELDLGDLEFEEEKGEEEEEGEVELDLLADQGDTETELDLSDLELDEEKSEDADLDLSELLGMEEEEEEPLKPAPKATQAKPVAPKAATPVPKPTPAKAAPVKVASTPKAAAAPPPKAAPKAAPKAGPVPNNKQEADSISQDEIDALFG